MAKIDAYRQQLAAVQEWDAFLLEESGLPGPRGNLELAKAVAWEIDSARCWRYAGISAEEAPPGTAEEFLSFCGVLGLGKLCLQGDTKALPALRQSASDPRWRTREAVAMALQFIGTHDVYKMVTIAKEWAHGTHLEQRAAIAGICRPALLKEPHAAQAASDILNTVTTSLSQAGDRKAKACKVLRQSLAYCWSVAVAASPEIGKPLMETWMASTHHDIRWMLKQNLKKKRLLRMDPDWVQAQTAVFE